MQPAEEDQLVEDLHLFVEAALFGQVADALQALALEGLVEEADAARVGQGDAHHHADGAGLARAVWAQKAEDLARVDGQAQIADGNFVLVGLGYTREFNNWHGFSRCSNLHPVAGQPEAGLPKPACMECSKARTAPDAHE